GDKLTIAGAGVNPVQLQEMLFAMRADQLLAASLAGSIEGLRDVVAHSLTSTAAVRPTLLPTKALGDSALDVVYTPVTPCRLVETRGTFAAVYQGGGAFGSNEIRNYAIQGGNGACLTQLPAGLNPSAIQIQVFGIPTTAGSGDIEILPQGSSFGSTATMVYIGSIAFNTVSTNAKINLANNQIGVQVRGGGAHVAIDVVGYFKRPGNYGGTHVVTGLYATDGGGYGNTATGDHSTVSGGFGNVAGAFDATVAGGGGNNALGNNSAIGGGQLNSAPGANSTVIGGFSNTASGGNSTVAGGAFNVASGHGSFAAGSYAKANYDGCFVWGDESTTNEVRCDEQNRFVVRATHGIFMFAAGNTQATYTGVVLPPGAQAWIAASDRAGKENLRSISPQAVLRKVVAMPVATWNWKSQDATIRHMGPMAQDFRAAFGLGETERGISTIDADGVALAAIQGLHQLVQEKDARIVALEKVVGELKRAIDALTARQ
ncbi:MAG TPA: tail fiber domain-containing protein, partial [Casimicrobiaceae bacterium]